MRKKKKRARAHNKRGIANRTARRALTGSRSRSVKRGNQSDSSRDQSKNRSSRKNVKSSEYMMRSASRSRSSVPSGDCSSDDEEIIKKN